MADWKKELVRLLKNGEHEASLTLRGQNIPKSLFRYRTCSEQNFQTLERGTVWVSPPENQNDPHDSRLSLAGKTVERILRSIWPRLMGLPSSELHEAENSGNFSERCIEIFNSKYPDVNKAKARRLLFVFGLAFHEVVLSLLRALALVPSQVLKITCFTTDVTSSQMWAYYAGGHQGYCVEYPLEAMTIADLRARWLYPVIYSNDRFRLWPMFQMSRRGTALIHWPVLTAIHKGIRWAHEQEWRIIAPADYNHNEIVMPWPSGIYLGNKIKLEDKQRLISIVAELERKRGEPILIYEMKASETDYSLLPVKASGV